MGRPPIGKHAMSGSERQRRYLERLLQSAKPAKTPSDTNAQELAQAKACIAELESKLAHTEKRLAGEQARVHQLLTEVAQRDAIGARFAPKPRTPKAPKPPLPPDEQRDKRIKAQATEIQNLKAKLRHMAVLTLEMQTKTGAMDFRTTSAIAKALHPDHKPTEEQRAEACRLFTAWKADNGKAQRKTRQKSQ